MELPLISVIIPVYNVEKYLSKCITSVQNQTYNNLEIILVDDGSTDNSGSICDRYKELDERIKVIHKKNGGQGSARNVGLQYFKGTYVTFLDSDDSMENNCISLLYDNLKENDLDISACNYGRYDEDGKLLSLFDKSEKDFIVNGIEAQKKIWYAECINLSPWGKLYKRSLWNKEFFKECRYYEDYATMHYIYIPTKRFGYIHYPLISYLVRSGSDVRSFNDLKIKTLDIAEDTIKYAENVCPEVLDAAIKKAINLHFHILLNMPLGEKKYKDVYQRIKKFVRKYRWTVIRDKRADKKIKIALIVSLFSYKATKNIYQYKKRKDILF